MGPTHVYLQVEMCPNSCMCLQIEMGPGTCTCIQVELGPSTCTCIQVELGPGVDRYSHHEVVQLSNLPANVCDSSDPQISSVGVLVHLAQDSQRLEMDEFVINKASGNDQLIIHSHTHTHREIHYHSCLCV